MVPHSNHPTEASAFPIKTLALFVFLCAAAWLGLEFSSSVQGTDFPDFYCAARMIFQGQGHQLYDVASQRSCQAHYALRVGTLYIHPPFEALVYLPVAWLSLPHAYILWSSLSLIFLAIAVRCLTRHALIPWDWRLNLAASITFTPVLLCCIQGQDSSLLLLLIVLALSALRSGHALRAGAWLALGLFKFQIVLPLALLLVLMQRNHATNLLKTFIPVALALGGISAAICGPFVFLEYPHFLITLSRQTFSGLVPAAMPNIHGLIWLFLRSNDSAPAIFAITIFSAILLAQAFKIANRFRTSAEGHLNASAAGFDLASSGAVLFALLISYHLNPHDLTIALIPIFLLLRHILCHRTTNGSITKWITWTSLGLLLFPPFHVLVLREGIYTIAAVPLLLLLLFSIPSLQIPLERDRLSSA